MDMQTISQIGIACTGLTAIWLTQQKSHTSWKRFACLFGMAGQPFWIYAAVSVQQWGMFLLTLCYTFTWALGIYNNWLRPNRKTLHAFYDPVADCVQLGTYLFYVKTEAGLIRLIQATADRGHPTSQVSANVRVFPSIVQISLDELGIHMIGTPADQVLAMLITGAEYEPV